MHIRSYNPKIIAQTPCQKLAFSTDQSSTVGLPSTIEPQKETILSLSNRAYTLSLDDLEEVISHIERNELQRSKNEDISSHLLLTEENVQHIHKLMTACAQFQTIRGAELAERFLSVVTLNSTFIGDEEEGYIYSGPTSKMFTIALNAWAQIRAGGKENNNPLPGRRAAQILEFMWQEYDKDPSNAIKPDVIHYTAVLGALSKTSSKKGVHLAQSLLEDAEQRSGVHHLLSDDDINSDSSSKDDRNCVDANLVPDRLCYNTVLHLLSKYFNCRNDDRERKNYYASEVLQSMKKIINTMDRLGVVLNDDSWLPNTRSYNCLLRACSFQLRNSMEETESVLQKMSARIQTIDHSKLDSDALTTLENNNVLPNIYTFNAIIQAYAASVNDDPFDKNIKKSEKILQALLKGDEAFLGFPPLPHLKPDLVTINSYLHLLANSGKESATNEAEIILKFLLHGIYDGRKDEDEGPALLSDTEAMKVLQSLEIQPDTITCSTAINAIANCDTLINSGERAEDLFSQVKAVNDEMTSESCHIGVINAWVKEAKMRNDGSVYLQAEAALKRMREEGFHPAIKVYNAVLSITGYACTDETTKKIIASNARDLLLTMIEECGDNRVAKPDIYSFNHVIKANIGLKEAKNKREGFFCSIDTFNTLQHSNICEANDQTFIHMFKLLQNSMTESVDSTNLCEELFLKCCKAGLTTNATLRIIENILPSTSLQRVEACKINKDGKLSVNNLPEEWSRNRRVGQNQRRSRNQSWRKY